MALVSCPECGAEMSDEAFACPHCGKPTTRGEKMSRKPVLGYEYKSETMLFGLPLVHIAHGIDPDTGRQRIAKGIIAIGDIAIGFFALGGIALGGLTFGGLSLGLFALGGCAIGVLLAMGGAAVGAIAVGGGAIGLVAIGGGAVGYYALGGGAFGVHTLSARGGDAEAVRFFQEWLGDWVGQLKK